MTLIQKIETSGCGCDAPETLSRLVSIDAALGMITDHVRPVADRGPIPLANAVGRVLAAPVVATCQTPPFDNSAMDGFAVSMAGFGGSGPWLRPVNARVPAGKTPVLPVTKTHAARIFTGAPFPPGADAVIMQEEVEQTESGILIHKRPKPGQNIRRAGEDMKRGETVLGAGCTLRAREIAACAAAGCANPQVLRKLRVALLVTGDEVQNAGTGRSDAGIWDINTPMLQAALSSGAIDLVHVGHGVDDRDAVQRQIANLLKTADLLITTGGISVGEEDHVKPAMQALGTDILFSGVAIKPGKPVSFGKIGSKYWLGLPGNPLSAFVTWQLFGTAILRALTGQTDTVVQRRYVITGQDIHRKPGRCELRPARITGFDGDGREVIDFERATHSGRVAKLPVADGLMFIPAEADKMPAGSMVEFQPFCDA